MAAAHIFPDSSLHKFLETASGSQEDPALSLPPPHPNSTSSTILLSLSLSAAHWSEKGWTGDRVSSDILL